MSTPGGLSWQGGWDEPGVLSLVIIETGIPGSGLFLYNGVPGVGTLLASVTESVTDPFGNTTQPGGFTVYNGSAYIITHVGTAFGGGPVPSTDLATGVASEAEHAQLFAFPNNTGLVNELVGTWLLGAGSSHDGVQAAVNLISAAANGAQTAAGLLGFVTSGVLTEKAFWDATGFQALGPGGGNGWYCNGTQTDTSTNTNANNATQPLTVAWTIAANDANAGTIYEVEVPYSGTFQTATFGVKPHLNASTLVTSLGDTVGGGFFSAGQQFAGTVRLKVQITATGSGGTANFFIDGGIGVNATRSSGANNNNGYLSSQRTGQAFNTTVANTVSLDSVWGASVASQTVTGSGSVFTRRGQ